MYVAGHLGDFGAFKPFKALKKGVTSAAKGVAKGAKVVAKPVAKIASVALAPVTVGTALATKAVFAALVKPIKSRLNAITDARARKLARERRGSTMPTPAERAEARNWNKNELKRRGPHGVILSMLAGPADADESLRGYDELGAEPISTATIAALVPALTKLAADVASDLAKRGLTTAVSAGTSAAASRFVPRRPPPAPPPEEMVYDDSAMEGVLPSGSVGAGVVFGALAVASGIGLYLTLK